MTKAYKEMSRLYIFYAENQRDGGVSFAWVSAEEWSPGMVHYMGNLTHMLEPHSL